MIALALAIVYPASAQVRYVGYASSEAPEAQPGTNLSPFLDVTDPQAWAWLEAAQRSTVVVWPQFATVDWNVPADAAWAEAWAAFIRPHVASVAAVYVADEPDCNYQGARFPDGWTPENCAAMTRKIDANIAAIHAVLPGVPTWVNYTSAYANWFTFANAAGRRLPGADWIGFDCYTPFAACFGRTSVEALARGLEAWMRPDQRLALYTLGYVPAGMTESDTIAAGQASAAYVSRDPRVVALLYFPWAWAGFVGARDRPAVRLAIEASGHALLGSLAVISPPMNVRIER